MLWRDLKVWQIYGANTNVGKTILSTILCKALQRRAPNAVAYLKPVSTGPLDEADDQHISRHAPGVISKCISQFSTPVSPHLAAKIDYESTALKDDNSIVARVRKEITHQAKNGIRYALLESAGGVLSPGPSGTVQADLYRPLRLPALLVGDSKLGGIATTISAFESLHVRGYDVDSVVLFNDPTWGNFNYIQEHFAKFNIQSHPLPLPPPKHSESKSDDQQMSDYYQQVAESPIITDMLSHLFNKHFQRTSKLQSLPSMADSIIWHPFRQHALSHNIIAIDSAYKDHFEAYNQESDPTFAASSSPSTSLTSISTQATSLTTPLFDASASWWTQGLGHGNQSLSLAAAHAAGRYGHVMFAHSVHEPALDLCHNLLTTLQNPRLARVFFTDNGSTGMEVAVKMALRASCQRYGWLKDDISTPVGIIGLKGSYHGDTIGVMNCSEPSVFNEKVDWYQPWGHWFDPPSILMRKGVYEISVPSSFTGTLSGQTLTFPTLSSIFDLSTRFEHLAFYKSYITSQIKHLVHDRNHRFGALILEPLIMGAGGMIFVDPLFQHALITQIRENPSLINPAYNPPSHTNPDSDPHTWTGLPVIADEVFTGLYRLGRPSSSSFLSFPSFPCTTSTLPQSTAPDISVHAKLLTGGLLPLSLTTASQSIFNTFLSSSKTDALLHGHSYTAHPIGCAVANKSLDEMAKLCMGSDEWKHYREAWSTHATATATATTSPSTELSSTSSSTTTATETNSITSTTIQSTVTNDIFSFFAPTFLTTLSHHPVIEGCFAIGTVLVMTLKSNGGSGYSSTATASLQSRLLTTLDTEGAGIHSRVLGDVLYLMTSMITQPEMVRRLETSLMKALDEEARERD